MAATPAHEVALIVVFPYNGDAIVPLHLATVHPHVDEIIVVEGTHTFTGKRKDALFIAKHYTDVFKRYADKVTFLVFTPPADALGDAWRTEALQRDFPLKHVRERWSGRRYVLLSCDADEVPSVSLLREARSLHPHLGRAPRWLEMNMMYYHFRWSKRFTWAFAIAASDEAINAGLSLNGARAAQPGPPGAQLRGAGNHFSYFGPPGDLVRKLESFSHTEYDAPRYKALEHVRHCMATGADLFGRPGEDCVPTPSTVEATFPDGWRAFATQLDVMQAPTKGGDNT